MLSMLSAANSWLNLTQQAFIPSRCCCLLGHKDKWPGHLKAGSLVEKLRPTVRASDTESLALT
jgi:hypothetical protein